MRITRARASIAATAMLAVSAACLAPVTGASASQQGFVTAPPAATAMSRAEAQRYWTPERIAAAAPLALAASRGGHAGAVRTAAPDPARVTAAAMRSVWVRKTKRYPNRVHGKLVGTYAGLGNFSCSATVVSSGSGSLITTAGHCAFDAGGTRRFATDLAFIPGFARGQLPYGVWSVTNLIAPAQWSRHASFDYDVAMMRTKRSPFGTLQHVVGSRGIGFGQSRRQRILAYGYPARGKPAYNGFKLIRCSSRQGKDPGRFGGPRGRAIRCDMKQGASGGGWVAQRSFVVSNSSHIYTRRGHGRNFGPYYGKVVKAMYGARVPGCPSIGPARCRGKIATIVGSNRAERLRGGNGRDVIAALGGNDRVSGGKGNDVICGGRGRDRLAGNGGRDRLEGGQGRDACRGGGGRNQTKGCRFGAQPG
ncbi:MAG: hypothetical protein KDB46_10365 [Solirubrobacterales bacterium]|nr:hypothetical protein [Solirubrobacterales bacterium]